MAKKNKYLHAPTNDDLQRINNGERLSDIRATPFRKAINGALNENIDEIEEIVEPSIENSRFKNKRSRNTRRHIYLLIGVFVTIMSIIGIVSTTKFAVDWVKRISDNTQQKTELEKYIFPLTIIDVPTFDNPTKLTDDVIIKACAWSFIMNLSTDSYKIQDDYFIVPQSDFEARAKKMFGNDISIKEHKSILDPICTIVYDSANKSYNIPTNPDFVSYKPEIEEIKKSPSDADILILKVGYYAPAQEWLPEDQKHNATKFLNYTVKKNGFSYIILSVQNPSDDSSQITNTNALPTESQDDSSATDSLNGSSIAESKTDSSASESSQTESNSSSKSKIN